MKIKSIIAAFTAVCTLATSTLAETFPTRPLTLVVPGAAGSIADVVARKVGEQLTKDLGQPVIVENKVGAGGTIAYDYLSRQKPDGYTLGIALGGFAIANVMYKSARFDVINSFTPVTQLSTSPMIFVTASDSPFATLSDLVKAAKERPAKLKYGSFGVGSSSHIAAEIFKKAAQIDVVHVPYKTGAATAPDLISGQLAFAVLDPSTAISLTSTGKIKALATSGEKRVPTLADVPTAGEAGTAFTSAGWLGLFAPAGIPEDILAQLNVSANKAMRQPDTLKLIISSGSQVPEEAPSPASWKATFADLVQTSSKVARDAGMSAE